MITVYRIIFALSGVFLLAVAFFSLVNKRMTEGFSLGWAVGAVFLFLMGVIPGMCSWTDKVSTVNMISLIILAVFLLSFVFWISSIISQLMRKTQELAMHVSLLNQENEKIMGKLIEVRKELHRFESQSAELYSQSNGENHPAGKMQNFSGDASQADSTISKE